MNYAGQLALGNYARERTRQPMAALVSIHNVGMMKPESKLKNPRKDLNLYDLANHNENYHGLTSLRRWHFDIYMFATAKEAYKLSAGELLSVYRKRTDTSFPYNYFSYTMRRIIRIDGVGRLINRQKRGLLLRELEE